VNGVSGGRCVTTGKVCYPSQTKAVGPDTTVGIYRCGFCHEWHRSSQHRDGNVRRAEKVRRAQAVTPHPSSIESRLDPEVVGRLRRLAS
jgi:hypothetical protein